MPKIQDIRTRWDLLRAVHPLFIFSDSLPTIDGADQGRYGSIHDDTLDSLKNEITMLRSDIKLNIIKQQQVDIEQLREQSDIDDLAYELDSLLDVFESLIDKEVLSRELEEHDKDVSDFPKLVSLRRQLQASDGEESTDCRSDLDINSRLSWRKRFSNDLMAQTAAYIRFPQDADSIGSCRRAVARFGVAIMEIFEDSVGRWKTEAQTQYYSQAEVETIQDAHGFSSACTTLFNLVADACGTPHHAKLHLSWFRREQLRMSIGTCQESRWISASFTRSFDESSHRPWKLSHVCSQPENCGLEPQITRIAFNSSTMWEELDDDYSETDSLLCSNPRVLNDLLCLPRTLRPMHRKLLGVLLACSLFQLYGSPWIQQQLGRESIYLPICPRDSRQLHQWYPHVPCTLSPDAVTKLHSDDIAAFGVLLMELEADDMAAWSEDDVEWPSDTKSNRVRLARILRDWEEDVSDEYRQVGRNCLDFESLAETFDHPKLGSDLKYLAIVYKCILDPLFRYLVKDFGKTAQLFQGIPGPWGSLSVVMNLSPSNAAKRTLFDDIETTKSDERIEYAKQFLEDLRPFFDKILRVGEKTPSLATLRTGPALRGGIRIAILDSGVDDTDPKIKGAVRSLRIKKRTSFVGQADDYADTYGHGTHVVRLLLETAPRAEIYIAKICHGKYINEEFMPGIARAIDWAAEECQAHIISMSFGFEDENDLIDSAVDCAVQKGRLVFAAASNNGGISGRARPARNENVMCVHACDGLGNKGDMNPNPVTDTSNFATLGVGVPSKWKGKEVWKSGTSFATPIAAGFAANILEFASKKCNLTAERRKVLYRRRGMQALFRKMSEKRDGYDFVHPARLWQDGRSDESVARDIENTIRSL